MADDHRLAQSGLNPCLEADLAQGPRAVFGGLDAGLVKGGIGGDARDGEQLEQPLKRGVLAAGEPLEHALQGVAGSLRLDHCHSTPRTQALLPVPALPEPVDVKFECR